MRVDNIDDSWCSEAPGVNERGYMYLSATAVPVAIYTRYLVQGYLEVPSCTIRDVQTDD